MRKIKKVVLIILIILVAWAFLRFVVGGSEDSWICVDDQWVEHGVPSAPMPTEPCGETNL
jgi:hypothetical protein